MAECYRCGVDGSAKRLFDGITDEGIVSVCENCLREEKIPLVKKPTTFQLKEAETHSGVYERLSKISGLNPKEHRAKFSPSHLKKQETLTKKNVSLRELIDKNYKEKTKLEKKPRSDLVENFHWVIMRFRRKKKLTHDELARAIGESKAAVEMAEKGVLPEDDHKLVKKLETFLGIKLIKDSAREKIQPKKLDFEKADFEELTISDLKEMKAAQDTKLFVDEIEEEIELNKEKNEELKKEKKGFWGRIFKKNKPEQSDKDVDDEDFKKILKDTD